MVVAVLEYIGQCDNASYLLLFEKRKLESLDFFVNNS